MIGALWILTAMIVVGIGLWIADSVMHKDDPSEDAGQAPEKAPERQCCGLHLVCEKDRPRRISLTPEYYDDEELDRFAGREADAYTAEEIDEFHAILVTMRPDEIAGWNDSLTQRRITPPAEIREEMILLIEEARQSDTER